MTDDLYDILQGIAAIACLVAFLLMLRVSTRPDIPSSGFVCISCGRAVFDLRQVPFCRKCRQQLD